MFVHKGSTIVSRAIAAMALVLFSVAPVLAYEQGDNLLAHQWITQQAVLFFRSQFGASEIDSFLGEVRTYPNGDNNRFIEGTFDEDVDRENPFNQTSPFFNHFWNFNATTFARPFDRGLFDTNDAAPNRAIKLFTGGYGLTAVYDTLYGRAQGAAQDRGILWFYRNDTGDNARKGRAYYWLGEAAHLLQDSTLPAHVLNDPHPVGIDQDPVHDWVDGRAFATGFIGRAAFDDNTARRWESWRFDATAKGVGRPGGTVPLETGHIRSAAQLRAMTLAQEWRDSVPNGAQAQSLPLYHLFLETAGRADDFDSRDVNGQVDAGGRRDNGGAYANWTRDEVNQVADVIAPRAMKATAELLRTFYSLVDSTPPNVSIPDLSADEGAPTPFGTASLILTATATDDISGVELAGYRFFLEQRGCCGWVPVATTGPDLPEASFLDLAPGVYRIRATVENGAGLTGESLYAYFEILTSVPVAVEDLQAAWDGGNVRLDWKLSPAAQRDLTAVRVQRSATAAGPFEERTTGALAPRAVMSFVDAAAATAHDSWYRLLLVRGDTAPQIVGPIEVTAIPSRTALATPREIAAGGPIAIRYSIGGGSVPVHLEIYDVSGHLVRALERRTQAAGEYQRTWDRRDEVGAPVARGVYLVQLRAGAVKDTKKLVLLLE